MNVGILIGLIFAALLFFLLLGIPVAFSLFGLAMIVTLVIMGPQSLFLGYIATFTTISKEIFIAVPLFIFMAGVLEFSGVISNLYNMMYKWMGGLRGGLAIGTIFAAVIIDATSGLGGTATVTLGILALPEMLRRGYDKSIALGCIPSGGALGPVIPPSVVMIILGGLTGLSIGKLFMGGIFPGIIIASLWSIYIAVRSALQPNLAPAIPPEARATWGEKLASLRYVIAPVFLVLLVLGSIYSGATTTTEAAGAGAVGALICAAINRQFSWQRIKQAMIMTVQVNAMVYFLLIGGTTFASIMATTGMSGAIRDMLLAISPNPMVLVILMQAVAVFLGLFMDAASNLMICAPIFWTVIAALPTINPLWWGVILTLSLCVGYITPPFGMNLFYLKGVVPKDVTMGDIYRSVIPYAIIFVIGIAICMVFPATVTLLPRLMLK